MCFNLPHFSIFKKQLGEKRLVKIVNKEIKQFFFFGAADVTDAAAFAAPDSGGE